MKAVRPTAPRPAWRVLPIVLAAMTALLAVVERVALPPNMRALLQVLVTAGGFSCIGVWVWWNRVALALEDRHGRSSVGPASRSLAVRVYDPWHGDACAAAAVQIRDGHARSDCGLSRSLAKAVEKEV